MGGKKDVCGSGPGGRHSAGSVSAEKSSQKGRVCPRGLLVKRAVGRSFVNRRGSVVEKGRLWPEFWERNLQGGEGQRASCGLVCKTACISEEKRLGQLRGTVWKLC